MRCLCGDTIAPHLVTAKVDRCPACSLGALLAPGSPSLFSADRSAAAETEAEVDAASSADDGVLCPGGCSSCGAAAPLDVSIPTGDGGRVCHDCLLEGVR